MRILVVDDHESVRRAVVDLLSSRTGFEVCGEAEEGSEALQKVQDLLPDIILLDISMPGLDGLEVARLLRQRVPTAKIVVMSQNDPALLLPGALAAGAHGCVDKGRLFGELFPMLERIMENFDKSGDDREGDNRRMAS